MTETTVAATALAAFLRGVERRGAAFAELQCGDGETGDLALAAALRAFRSQAAALPMAAWPQRFWSLLASAPQLRQAPMQAQWPPPLAALAGIGPAARAALLLRLAAGLDEAPAAAALGWDEDAYRQALGEACPRDADGRPDAAAWRALAEAIQRQLRELPPQRLARLSQLRDEAMAVRAGEASPRPAPSAVRSRRGGRWWWAILVLLLCAAALLLTTGRWSCGFVAAPSPSAEGPPRLDEDVAVEREELPPPAEPAARFDPAAALSMHPDAALLKDAAGEAIARQADFYAWYFANPDALLKPPAKNPEIASDPEAAAALPSPFAAAPPDAPEPLPVLDPAQRAAQWDALPQAQRSDRRARYAAWRALPESERTQLRGAAAQFAALPEQQQQALRTRFEMLDDMQRRGWRLGPAIGAQYADLYSLLAFVPAEESAALLAALKALDAAQRAELAALAQRTPPQRRDALRRELLATPAQQRGGWIHRRASSL